MKARCAPPVATSGNVGGQAGHAELPHAPDVEPLRGIGEERVFVLRLESFGSRAFIFAREVGVIGVPIRFDDPIPARTRVNLRIGAVFPTRRTSKGADRDTASTDDTPG